MKNIIDNNFQNAGVPNYLVMTVKAVDHDPGENGRIGYHLKVGNRNVQENEEFSIDQETGELRAKIILDREVKSKFEVNIALKHIMFVYEYSFFLTSFSNGFLGISRI